MPKRRHHRAAVLVPADDLFFLVSGQNRAFRCCTFFDKPQPDSFLSYHLCVRASGERWSVVRTRNSRHLCVVVDEVRGALESALWQKKTEFEKWGLEIERRQQRGRRGGPAAGGGGWSGGGGWFRWFSGGGFWNSAKQIVLTILGIIVLVLVLAVVNSLLSVPRQIRRVLTFVAHCVSQGISVSASGPKSTSVDSGNLAAVPVEVRAGMSANKRVVRKWGMD